MKSPAGINDDILNLDAKLLPETVDPHVDYVMRILVRFEEYLHELKAQYQKAVSKNLELLSSDLAEQFSSKIEEICKQIAICKKNSLTDRNKDYLKIVALFNELLVLENKFIHFVKYVFQDRAFPEKIINDTQKQILDAIIEIWFKSILSSFLGLIGLQATLNEELFERYKEGFKTTEILKTLQDIKNVFRHLYAKEPENVMPWWLWPRWPLEMNKGGIKSLTDVNDETAVPIRKQAIFIYISNALANKIKQLEDINFNKLRKDLESCIEQNDFDGFKNIITIFKNNQISIDLYQYGLKTPLICAAFYGRQRMVEFLLTNQDDFRNSKKLPSLLLLNALGIRVLNALGIRDRLYDSSYSNDNLSIQGKLFDSKFNITAGDRCAVLELLVKFGFLINDIPYSVEELVISHDVALKIVNLILMYKKHLDIARVDLKRATPQKIEKLLDPIIIIREFKKHPHKITKEKLEFFLSHDVNFYQKDAQGFSIVDCLLAYYEKVTITKADFEQLLTRLFDNTLPDYYHLRYVDHSGKIAIPVPYKGVPSSLTAAKELTDFIEEYHEQKKPEWKEASETFKNFPKDLLLEVLCKMDGAPIELVKLSLLCKYWYSLVHTLKVFEKIVGKASGNELSHLMRASCLEGSFEKVSILLSSNRINLNYIDGDHKGFLHHICISGSIEIAVLLLNKLILNKAEYPVNFADLEGNLPLHLAVAADNLQMCQLLLQISPESQTNVKNAERDSPLHKVKSAAIAEMLILHRAKVKCWNQKDESPLFRAIDLELTEVVACLIKFKAEVNERLHLVGVGTFLHMAVRKGNLEILRLLLENGADFSAEFNCFEGSEEDKFLTPRRLAQVIDKNLLMDPLSDENFKLKMAETAGYLKNVEEKYAIMFSRLHAIDKVPEGWLFVDNQKKEAAIRKALKKSQNMLYLKIFEKDCSVDQFQNLISGLEGATYLGNVAKKCLIVDSILSEAKKVRQSYLYKREEKANAIEIALANAISRIYAKIFAEDCSVKQFEDLILNPSRGWMSVKKALALDFTPRVIGSIVSALGFFGGDKDSDQHDPQNSPDKPFNP